MATKKVARLMPTAKAQPSFCFILQSTHGGESHARVYEKATKRHLATAHGTADYARRASELFASEWSLARSERLAKEAVQS